MESVKLRRLKPEDRSVLAQLANSKKVWDNVRDHLPHPYTEADADFFINLVKDEDPFQNFGIAYEEELCGVIGVMPQPDIYRKSAELGYWIGEPYWGKGIATTTVRLITDYAFNVFDMHRVYAGVFEYNVGSMRVLEKNGYQKEGVFKQAVIKNGAYWDEHRYYKLRDD